MKITLLGSGCSKGTPKIGCNCAACTLALNDKSQIRRRYGVLIQEDGLNILVDAGPDLKSQLLDLNLGFEHIDNIFLTHAHFDHVGGLGEIYASIRNYPINIHGWDIHDTAYISQFNYLAKKGIIELNNLQPFQPVNIKNLSIIPVPINHGIPTLGYVITTPNSKLVLASDTDAHIPDESLELMRNSNLLFIDSWADSLGTAHKLVKELFVGKQREIYKYDPSLLFHMLFSESISLSKRLNAEMAIAVHIGHLSLPHTTLVNKFESERFQIGFDMMQFELE